MLTIEKPFDLEEFCEQFSRDIGKFPQTEEYATVLKHAEQVHSLLISNGFVLLDKINIHLTGPVYAYVRRSPHPVNKHINRVVRISLHWADQGGVPFLDGNLEASDRLVNKNLRLNPSGRTVRTLHYSRIGRFNTDWIIQQISRVDKDLDALLANYDFEHDF